MSDSASTRLDGVAHFDVRITDKNLDETVKTLITHIKKSWDISMLQKKSFDDGITNKLYGYYVNTGGDLKCSTKYGEYGRSDIVLVRIYGMKTELFIDRAQELRNFEELSKQDLAPALYCTFSNGYCYQYIEGHVLNADDFQKQDVLDHCAKYMATLHSFALSESYLKYHPMSSTLFDMIQKFISLIPKEFNCPEKQKRFIEKGFTVEKLQGESNIIANAISEINNKKISFCHNDLLCANFIFNEQQEKLFVIDYEYGTPNYSAYDIANNFNEMAGIDNVDYSLFPNKATQMRWLKQYLEHLKELNDSNDEITSDVVEELYILVNKFTLASHLFWGTWALVQAQHSLIEFDFMGYGFIRLGEYYNKKEEVLALSPGCITSTDFN